MLLQEFLDLQEVQDVQGELDREITGLSYDSRRAGKGTVFFAVPGINFDGHEFVAQAAQSGAAAVVVEKKTARPQGTTWVQVKDVRRTMGVWAAHFYGYPSRSMKVIGVTGTNGKTTISYLVESILTAAGFAPGVIGTINYRYCGRELPSHHTTPESLDLQALLAEMKSAGTHAAVMEVSSHALAQARVSAIDFDVALFSNLSRDHLDYHRDMDDYFTAKSRLFTVHLKNSVKGKKAAVIHAADPRGAELLDAVRELGLESWSYGREGEWDVRPLKVESDVHGLRGTIQAKGDTLEFFSPLIGAANLENILGAVGIAFSLGLPAPGIREGIARLKSVPGRMEKVDNALDISVLVDYAHTPDALERALVAIGGLLPGRGSPGSTLESRVANPKPERREPKLICVFGCGGDRDRGKRPLMGEIAARLSDLVFLTSDNPRTENPAMILKEIEAGVEKTGLKKFRPPERNGVDRQLEPSGSEAGAQRGYCVEADRREAIRMAIRWARAGDVVLIAGKGHEDYQILGTTKIHFDDRLVAREELSSIVSQRSV